MKQNLLKTMLVSTALVAGTMGVWAENGNGIITSLPVAEDFENGTGIFKGGESFDHTAALGKILRVYNVEGYSKAVATFDTDSKADGNQAYEIKNNEQVTISYTAFHGWLSKGKVAKFSVSNSAGVELVSYSYDYNTCNITDVSVGGISVPNFKVFKCQSTRTNDLNKGADGLDKNTYNKNTEYNPQVTMVISGNGIVSVSFVKTKGKDAFNEEFSAKLGDNVAKDLASITIENSGSLNTNAGRAYAIDNMSITSKISADVPANYVIKKVCGSVVLGEESFTGIEGKNPTISEDNIFVDGKKYIYVSNDSEEKGAIVDGSVYTLTYREAATYNYSVTGKVDDVVIKEFVKDKNFEGETVSSPYLRYVEKDGVWYEAVRGTSAFYKASTVLDSNNQELVIAYKKSDINNVAYFKEAEEIEGLTVSTNQNADVRCSNAAGAYNSSETPVVVTTLPAGTYQLTIGLWGGKDTQNFKLNDGGKEPWTIPFTGSFQDVSKELVLEAETEISIPKSDAANGRCLDYVLVQKTAEPVAVSAIKFATYVPTCNVVAPAEVKVYTAKVNEAKSAVVLTEVPAGSVIAKGTPVLVGAEEDSYTFEASAGEATTVADNDLKAAAADTKGDGATIYALVEQDGKAVFAPLKEGVAVSLGHAYLKLPAASATRFYSIQFGGETTGINEVNAAAKADGAYYTLQGVKTTKAAKGIYIHNGKKVVIK